MGTGKRGLLATEGKRKSEGVIASAAWVWLSRVEPMAKEAQSGYSVVRPVFLAPRYGGRNHVRP